MAGIIKKMIILLLLIIMTLVAYGRKYEPEKKIHFLDERGKTYRQITWRAAGDQHD